MRVSADRRPRRVLAGRREDGFVNGLKWRRNFDCSAVFSQMMQMDGWSSGAIVNNEQAQRRRGMTNQVGEDAANRSTAASVVDTSIPGHDVTSERLLVSYSAIDRGAAPRT